MKPFKCIKQLILQSGIYVLFSALFHILITNCMYHPWVCNVREQVFVGFEMVRVSICETLGVVKRTPKSPRPTHNYSKMAVAGNLPQNLNSLETFDDNELLKRYRL